MVTSREIVRLVIRWNEKSFGWLNSYLALGGSGEK